MNPPDPKFKQLQTIWYGKLAESGFSDIEQDEKSLKVWSMKKSLSSQNENRSPEEILAKRDMIATYYTEAEHFLNGYRFKTLLDKFVWGHHSTGLSIRKISKLLPKENFKTLSYVSVRNIIVRLRKTMIDFYGQPRNFE